MVNTGWGGGVTFDNESVTLWKIANGIACQLNNVSRTLTSQLKKKKKIS